MSAMARNTTAESTAACEKVCWICGSGDISEWKSRGIGRPLVPEDLRITDARYGTTLGLWRCRECGFIFADGDDLGELTALYEQLADDAYEESQDSRALQMQWLLGRVLKHAPEARTLLDIGAGAGLLVAMAKERGLEAVGVEPSRALAAAGPRLNGVEVLQGVYPHPQLTGRRFDIVCLVDVIEHVADPVRMLRDCAGALGDNGVLVVVTPDVGSLAARLLGRRWWHFRLAHVGYFSRKTLTAAAAAAGLIPVRVFRARWFFRLSYIAERLTRYLPIAWLNRLAVRMRPGRWLYGKVIPVNPRDSMVVIFSRGA
jgi:2-polyprenyl-3-methyl-5-hydroxy-6-metoxy-1,4-benzoquinol methylase